MWHNMREKLEEVSKWHTEPEGKDIFYRLSRKVVHEEKENKRKEKVKSRRLNKKSKASRNKNR
jgi:hypothetical protein